MTTTDSKKMFILWVKKNNPKLYRAALMQANKGQNLLGMGGWLDTMVTTITDVAPKYLQYKQQKKVMKMQMKRAARGLPPANVADYAPVIKTEIEIAPETRKSIMRDTGKMMSPYMIGAGVLGVTALFLLLNKR